MFASFILPLFLLNEISASNALIECPISAEELFYGAENDYVYPISFLLYTSHNRYYPENLTFANCYGNTNYNPKLKTVMIISGYEMDPYAEPIIFLKAAYLYYQHCNVIIVDWSLGAALPLFPYAVRNTLPTGKYIAEQLESLKRNCDEIDFSNFHIIGYSLGCQVAGFLANHLKIGKIGRITGLDCAGTCFEGNAPEFKLDISDAYFVDFITTSISLQGFVNESAGHLNFKPDGGHIGRGCGDEYLMRNKELDFAYEFAGIVIPEIVFECSHTRAVYLFGSSLYSKIPPVAYQCKDYETFKRGECSECGEDGKRCAMLGIHAEKYPYRSTNETVTMYMATTFTNDYFLYHYHVEVTLGSGPNITTEVGKMLLVINYDRSETVNVVLDEVLYVNYNTDTLRPGEKKQSLIVSTYSIYPVISLEFIWYTTLPRADSKLSVKCVKIVPMNNLETDRSRLTMYGTSYGGPIYPEEFVLLNLVASC
ncbi:lipase member H-like [Centruroides sculpturatus]|uniref:lipase member H-like n=1 Tax=Centruroides sculpturatus TaxID=218467 RepID=UPI000C6DBC64|nr:lipase member H-like [Centruroides sculpturatus]